jgi:hypothetical protein
LHYRIKFDRRNFLEQTSVSRSSSGNQENQPKALSFLPFADSLKEPSTGDIPFDWRAFSRDRHVFLSFVAAERVLESRSGDLAVVATEDLFAVANELNGKFKIVDEIDESLLCERAGKSDAVLCRTGAALEGVVVSEVLKGD